MGGDVEGGQLVPWIFGTGFIWWGGSLVGINVNKNYYSVIGDNVVTHSPTKVSIKNSE